MSTPREQATAAASERLSAICDGHLSSSGFLYSEIRALLSGAYEEQLIITEKKDAEIERLRKRIADLEHASNLPRVEEIQGVYREADYLAKIERLKGELAAAKHMLADATNDMSVSIEGTRAWLKNELAEAVLLMEQGRECLRQLVSLANVNAETRKMLRYLGNTLNLFLQKHTPPADSDPIKDLCEALKERGMGFVFWVCDDPKHRGVTWEHGKEGSVATCDVCGKKSSVRPPPLNCGSAAAGESPSHSGGGGLSLEEVEKELSRLGWTRIDGAIWRSPLGKLHGGTKYAWKIATGKSALREVPPQSQQQKPGGAS